jgi:hypothetical protein
MNVFPTSSLLFALLMVIWDTCDGCVEGIMEFDIGAFGALEVSMFRDLAMGIPWK